MARTVDHEAYRVKREEILEAALQLVSTKGYERMAIQDLLAALEISKGAFYHYFRSKGALLEALIEVLLVGAERVLAPIAHETRGSAPDALSRFFAAFAAYKAEQRPFILAVLPVWYADENAIVREKVREATIERLTPLLASIVSRGCDAGAFRTTYPDQAARVVLELTQDLADRLARMVITHGAAGAVAPRGQRPSRPITQAVAQLLAATTEAIERVLAAPPGSIHLAARGTLDTWFDSAKSRRKESRA